MDGRQVARETADENGNFWLAGFGPGLLTLVVTARGHQPGAAVLRVRAGAVIDEEFVLTRVTGLPVARPGGARGAQRTQGAEVRGVVRAPGGAPVPGILVTAATTAGDIVASAVTGEHGTYRLAGLGSGEHVLAAIGHPPVSAAVHVGAGATAEVTMRLGTGLPAPPRPLLRAPAVALFMRRISCSANQAAVRRIAQQAGGIGRCFPCLSPTCDDSFPRAAAASR